MIKDNFNKDDDDDDDKWSTTNRHNEAELIFFRNRTSLTGVSDKMKIKVVVSHFVELVLILQVLN